jgi:hypothetical protein
MRYAAITLATILSLTGSITVAKACDAACEAANAATWIYYCSMVPWDPGC